MRQEEPTTAFADPELVELFAAEPELLAIADAIAATVPARTRRRLLPGRRLAVAAAVGAAVAVAAVTAPWHGSGEGVVGRALAAIGDDPVLHTVITQDTGETVVDLSTGASTPQTSTTETWYDASQALEHSVTTVGGTVTENELQSPAGSFDQDGRVIDCSWIAAHPVEATSLGVSCNYNGQNGTTPKTVPEPAPTIDPALSGYLSQYQDALQSGQADQIGTGTVNGTDVIWLELSLPAETPSPGAPGPTIERSEQVAVATGSYEPVLVRLYDNGQQVSEYQVEEIETVPFDASDFAKPAVVPDTAPTAWKGSGSTTVTPAQAAQAMTGALWPGQTVDGLPLVASVLTAVKVSYGKASSTPPASARQLELDYGTAEAEPGPMLTVPFSTGDLDRSKEFVVIDETTDTVFGPLELRLSSGPAPSQGTMLVSSSRCCIAGPPATPGGQAVPEGTFSFWTGSLVEGDAYVRIEASSEQLLIGAAQALAPIG